MLMVSVFVLMFTSKESLLRDMLPKPLYLFLRFASIVGALGVPAFFIGEKVPRRWFDPEKFPSPADPFILAVDQLGDPGNFGTILRTARAAGLKEFWYTAGSADPFAPKVTRSALGAQFGMILREFADLETLTGFAARCGYKNI